MEMSQTPCIAILHKQKCPFVFFYKMGKQKGRTCPAWGIGISGREEVEKGHGKVNIVQMLCTHVCKCKNDTY
jgi:hypothetical protein